MNKRERVIAAFHGKEVDHVPVDDAAATVGVANQILSVVNMYTCFF